MLKNLASAGVSPIGLYLKGMGVKQASDALREGSKLHTLRGGTAGCYIESRRAFFGANPREALGRFMGYQLKKSQESLLLFESGFASEAQFESNVRLSGVDYKRDEDYPILLPNWSGSYPLSGRPDGVLFKDGKPVMGIELKAIVSESSAQEIMVKRIPKLDNVCQAVRYSMATGLPWVLVYTNLARQGKWGNIVKVGHVEFFISIRNGEVWIEDEIGERKTILTTQGIKDYDDALVYAFTDRDISILDWGDVGVFGDDTKYDSRTYNNWDMMVNPNLSFDQWEESAKIASTSNYLINYKSKSPNYCISHVRNPEIEIEFKSLEEARKHLTELNKTVNISGGGEE
jgi:hypothetical protein